MYCGLPLLMAGSLYLRLLFTGVWEQSTQVSGRSLEWRRIGLIRHQSVVRVSRDLGISVCIAVDTAL